MCKLKNFLWLAVSVCSVVLTGCVSSGAYKDLQASYEGSLKREEELKTAIGDNEKQIVGLEKKNRDQERSIAQIKERTNTIEGEKKDLVISAQEMKTALDDLTKRKVESEKRVTEYKELLNKFKDLINSQKLNIKIVNGRMVVNLPTDILFPPGSATLSDDGKAAIAEVASLLALIPDKRFQVEGHTDNRPINTALFPTNWELAAARAIGVVKTMVDANLPPQRISAASFAEYKPAANNLDKDGRSMNRRIAIVVEPDLTGLPGIEELNKLSE